MDDEWERPARAAVRPRPARPAPSATVDAAGGGFGAAIAGWIDWLVPGRRTVETPG